MKVRLSFAEITDPDVEFWLDRLKSFGLKVTSERSSGIDAEGEPEAIEKALGTKIRISKSAPPQLDKIRVTEGEGKAPPLAYFPREPTFY